MIILLNTLKIKYINTTYTYNSGKFIPIPPEYSDTTNEYIQEGQLMFRNKIDKSNYLVEYPTIASFKYTFLQWAETTKYLQEHTPYVDNTDRTNLLTITNLLQVLWLGVRNEKRDTDDDFDFNSTKFPPMREVFSTILWDIMDPGCWIYQVFLSYMHAFTNTILIRINCVGGNGRASTTKFITLLEPFGYDLYNLDIDCTDRYVSILLYVGNNHYNILRNKENKCRYQYNTIPKGLQLLLTHPFFSCPRVIDIINKINE